MIRCPACGYFATKLRGEQVEIEINCANPHCKTTIRALKESSGKVTVTATPKESKE